MDNKELKGLEYLCNLIVKGWIKRNVITEEFEEWYTFGLYSFVSGIINIFMLVVLGIILGCINETIVYMTAFIFSREFMGGYHCDTPLRCKITSIMIYLIVMSINYFNIFNNYILYMIIVGFIFGNIVIYVFCPVQNHNKILEKSLQKKYKIISYFIYNILLIMGCGLSYINSIYANIVISTLLIVVIMVVIGYYKERRIYNVK